MENNATPGNVDPQEFEHTKETWHNFTLLIKYSTISIIILLILMACFLV